MGKLDLRELALELMQAHASAGTVNRPSARDEDFSMQDAYAVGAELLNLQREQGHTPVGRKIGFTNRAIWARLDLDSVIWSYMYDNTVKYATDNRATVSLAGMAAPKIEPEIVFKLKAPLTSGFEDASTILQAVEWIALGYEIVDCNYANWRFKAADMVADFGFHAAMVIGEPRPLGDLEQLVAQLAEVTVKLYKNGELAAEGAGKNVLESPALSLGNVAATIARQPEAAPLAAGEVITSGTLTEAQFIKPGEEWNAELSGLELPPLTVKFE
jgi:2-oxo-3-hexenedioate decarboxylase